MHKNLGLYFPKNNRVFDLKLITFVYMDVISIIKLLLLLNSFNEYLYHIKNIIITRAKQYISKTKSICLFLQINKTERG